MTMNALFSQETPIANERSLFVLRRIGMTQAGRPRGKTKRADVSIRALVILRLGRA